MNFDALKNAIQKSAEKNGISEYEIYYSENERLSAKTLKNEISSLSSNVNGGIGFRCRIDGKMGYAGTQLMEEAEMNELVLRAIENARNTEKSDEVGIFKGSETYGKTTCPPFVPLSADEIKNTALSVQQKLYSLSPKITDGTQSGAESSKSYVRLVNSYGLDLENTSGLNVVFAKAVADDNGERQNDFATDEYGKSTAEELAQTAISGALSKMGADSVNTGKYDIVIDAKQMRTLLSTFSSAFSAKTAQEGMSMLADKEGEKIASDIINITDDPMREGLSIQASFDAEGVATFRKSVVKNGVLQTLLHNRETALRAGKETTGNAGKGGYAGSIGVRTYSFCIEAGENTLDELFSMADGGIYITEVKGLHAGANAVTGDFSIESAGFLIENSKPGKPVKSFTIAGNFFELIKNISALSDKTEFGPGGAFGAPAVLVPNMSVAGK